MACNQAVYQPMVSGPPAVIIEICVTRTGFLWYSLFSCLADEGVENVGAGYFNKPLD